MCAKKKGNTNHSKRNSKQRSRYVVIVKVGNNPDGTAKCLKYRFNDLLKFTSFLDNNHTWSWFNVYSNIQPNQGQQLGSFTKNNRPTTAKL